MPMDQKIERGLKVIKKLFQMVQNPEEAAAPNGRERSMTGEEAALGRKAKGPCVRELAQLSVFLFLFQSQSRSSA